MTTAATRRSARCARARRTTRRARPPPERAALRRARLYACPRPRKARGLPRLPHTAMSHHWREWLRALSMNAQRHVSDRQAFSRCHEPSAIASPTAASTSPSPPAAPAVARDEADRAVLEAHGEPGAAGPRRRASPRRRRDRRRCRCGRGAARAAPRGARGRARASSLGCAVAQFCETMEDEPVLEARERRRARPPRPRGRRC